jgi:hypothetical protein
MQQAELAQRRRLQQIALPGLPTAQLAALRGALRSLAMTGWHWLIVPLHQSRSREAARTLQRYRGLIEQARANSDETFLRE